MKKKSHKQKKEIKVIVVNPPTPEQAKAKVEQLSKRMSYILSNLEGI